MSTPDTLLLTGIPRGGTTLACRLLGESADCVSLFEPFEVAGLPADPGAAIARIEAWCEAARQSLLSCGQAPSKVRDGAVPDNPISAPGSDGQRRLTVDLGQLRIEPPAPGFRLVVKHNAAFLALLPRLAAHFPVLGVVRNPLSVLASWQTVPLPVREGRVPAGERLDPALAAALAAQPDVLRRQVHILDWCFEQLAQLPAEDLLAYEAVVADGGAQLRARAGLRGPTGSTGVSAGLRPRNANPAYAGLDIAALERALLDGPGAWRRHYAPLDLAQVRQTLEASGG